MNNQNKTSHTPGPWIARLSETVGTKNDCRVTTDTQNGVRHTMAYVPLTALNRERSQLESNARLIAAAPELLQALSLALVVVTRDVQKGSAPSGLENTIRAAIAKATT